MPPKPKPLHRSLIFWAGILVFGSLSWAWWDSWRSELSISCYGYSIGLSPGGVKLTNHSRSKFVSRPAFRPPEKYEISLRMLMLPLWQRGIPDPLADPASAPFVVVGELERVGGERETVLMINSLRDQRRVLEWELIAKEIGNPPSAWLLYLPFPFLLAAALLPWLGALTWRARRLRRKEISSAC